jgi:hypothetical protein
MDCQKLRQIYINVCNNNNLNFNNDNIHLPFYKNLYKQNIIKNECKDTEELFFACCCNKKNQLKKECNDFFD